MIVFSPFEKKNPKKSESALKKTDGKKASTATISKMTEYKKLSKRVSRR